MQLSTVACCVLGILVDKLACLVRVFALDPLACAGWGIGPEMTGVHPWHPGLGYDPAAAFELASTNLMSDREIPPKEVTCRDQ